MAQKAEELSDVLLLLQCSEGNQAAFNILFRRYSARLYNYTYSFTKDRTVAEELVMDVMLGLWLKKGNISIKDDLGPYLFRAMKNALINHWRKKVLPTTVLYINEEYQHADPKSADDDLMSRELNHSYHLQLNALSPQRKKVFELSRKENMSHREIASELKLSVKTVENHIGAAIAFLKKNLKTFSDSALLALIFF